MRRGPRRASALVRIRVGTQGRAARAYEQAVGGPVAFDGHRRCRRHARRGIGRWLASPGMTERVSVDSAGIQADSISGRRGPPALSGDGLVVAFDSLASNLVPGDTNRVDDVFVHDRVSGETERVSVAAGGTQGQAISVAPAINADGLIVAFESDADNLVAGDTNGRHDVFVRDRAAGTTERVSVASDGTQGDNTSFGASISADGRFVAFVSDASNLVPDKTTMFRDVYVHDRLTRTTERASLTSAGTEAKSNSTPPAISDDGRFVAFAYFGGISSRTTRTDRPTSSSATASPAPPNGPA
jgi:Tol biopolymer transport system component